MHSMLTLLFLLLATPALATDGVLEINQTCAVQTGCFPGDGPGFPVTITGQAGSSYRLTSNLSLPGPSDFAILVTTSHISVDLGGNKIVCTVFTPPSTISFCTDLGQGRGISVDVIPRVGNEFRNGSITGMGDVGLDAGAQAVVRNLRISENGNAGARVFEGSSISDCIVWNNGNGGLHLGSNSSYRGNTLMNNFGDEVRGTGVNAGGNVCNGSLTCP